MTVSRKSKYLPAAGITIAAQERDKSDCKFLIPATSTQSGPIVCRSVDQRVRRAKG